MDGVKRTTSTILHEAFSIASPPDMLRFLALVDIQQKQIAEALDVSPQLVSFWVQGIRCIPRAYSPLLGRLVERSYQQAMTHQHQQLARLFPALVRQCVLKAFEAPLLAWAAQVWQDSFLVQEQVSTCLKQMRPSSTRQPWRRTDFCLMADLCDNLQRMLEKRIGGRGLRRKAQQNMRAS